MDSRFYPQIIRKNVFIIGQVPSKIWVENSVFAYKIEKSFTEVLPPHPPMTGLILLHTVVVLHFTHLIKMA